MKTVVCLLYLLSLVYCIDIADQKCKQCRILVETFKAGMRLTEKQHFAGGNTDWEERKLGKFATSETRFIEVVEHACRKENLEDTKEFDAIKDAKFKCQSLVEENEELLENWFFKLQESYPDLHQYVCVDELKRCCPPGHFGKACEPCPGANQQQGACFGRGTCHGEGVRSGNGKCNCDRGYVGVMCSNCDAHFYPVVQNDSFIECAECFDGCASGCTDAGPKGCRACRNGYKMDAEEGCVDIDECLEDGKCTKANEMCINTVGSYQCGCQQGFRRNKDQSCEIDIEAKNVHWLFQSDVMLRITAYTGLFFVSFVIYFHNPSVLLTILLLAAASCMIFVEYYITEDLIPDEAREYLQQ